MSESFSAGATTAKLWTKAGDACLTAGTGATPATSVPACGATAPQDAAGKGALQITSGISWRSGMVVENTPLPTAHGLQITFTDYAFHGTSPGGEGVALFLTDAAHAVPTAAGKGGAGLAYASTASAPGIANGYVGVGFDEAGLYSSLITNDTGGPGTVPETIAVRGSAAIKNPYIGGVTNTAGKPVSLPFALDTPTLQTRPATAPTIQATLTAAGLLTAAIDRHNGAGFVTYYSHSIVGVGGQPAVPAQVYLGLSASNGASYSVHQVSGLVVTTTSATSVATPIDTPPSIVSANGSLVFNVSAQANPNTGRPQFSYNGQSVPPTLRLVPGDTLSVNFTNNLPKPAAGSGYTNNSNLHYHGLHVSPQAPGDDSIDMLAAPGQSLHYTIHIPTNHPPGLYWYHTHAHGEAERQTLSGMSGALIIDGIVSYTPQVASMTERVLIARDTTVAGGVLPNADLRQIYGMNWAMQHGVGMHGAGSELHASSTSQTRNPYARVDPTYRRFLRPLATSTHCASGNSEQPVTALTLNTQTQPSIRIAPGEKQFWRVVNAGADTYLDLAVDNTQMQIIALDGVPLSKGVGTPAAMNVSHWVLPPASRVEFIITGPPAGSTAYVRTNCFDAGPSGSAMPATILASIDPSAAAAVAAPSSRLVARVAPAAKSYRFSTAAAIRSAAVSATRTIFYSDQYTINGIAYDPAAPPQFYAQSGTVEEWTIQNNSGQVHTFHIHQVHFVVEAINGAAQSEQFVMDNVNVPAATASGPGSVKVLLDFTDPLIIGTFLVHCHILSHEDAGMMAKIRIGKAPPLKLSASTVNFASPTAALQKVTITGGAAPYSVTGCSGVANAAISSSTISIVPAGAGACVLTIADASAPSVTSTISVQVSGPAAVVTLNPTSVSFTTPTAAAQNVAINGGTQPYSAAGCGGVAKTGVSGGTLTVTPAATGTCSVTITDAKNHQATLSVAVNSVVSGGSPLDNLTFHQNSLRTGWYQNETTLTTANVGSSNFGKITTLTAPSGSPAFGKVYAQPLFVTGETAADGRAHNLVIVAGTADQVYAFDETTHAVVWHRDFTNPGAGIRAQMWSDSGCSDVNPYVGIVGTPVIDRGRDALYVVVATMENNVPYTRLHAIALGNGNDRVTPTVISGSVALATGGVASVNSVGNMNRAALLEANGNIYVALGSHCDGKAGIIHGWVIAYSASSLQETGNLDDLTNANDGSSFYMGSPWMGGFGPAADAAGNVYFATGNGPFNGKTDFAMSVLKMPGNLNLGSASFFSPIQEAADSAADADLGAGGVMLLPDQPGAYPHLLIAGGKCSANNLGCFKYILNRDSLGGQRAGNAGAVWAADTGGGVSGTMRGGPAYFEDGSGVQHIVYGTGPINTYNLSTNPVGIVKQSSTQGVSCFVCKDAGSQEIVSSNGTRNGTAIVWAVQGPGNSGGTVSIYAFNALNMGTTLFHGASGTWNQAPGTSYVGGAMISPLVANGRVYVPAENTVGVFGLLH